MGDVRKHDPSPELLVVQKTHGLIDQSLLISYWLQFVQVHTLRGKDSGDMAYFTDKEIVENTKIF